MRDMSPLPQAGAAFLEGHQLTISGGCGIGCRCRLDWPTAMTEIRYHPAESLRTLEIVLEPLEIEQCRLCFFLLVVLDVTGKCDRH